MSHAFALARQFEQFDAQYPQVWELFLRFTFQVIHVGYQHHSADAVLHRVRWETGVEIGPEHEYKINNNYSAFYARKFHRTYPEHAGFFRTRISAADQSPEYGDPSRLASQEMLIPEDDLDPLLTLRLEAIDSLSR